MEIDKHKKQFGNQAENYTKYRLPYIEEVHSLLFSTLPKGSTKILDLACGTGKSTEPLVKNGLEIFGVDHDPLMIKEAQKQAAEKGLSIQYSVSEVENLLYEDNQFDAITVGTAFHWFVNEKALAEIKRVLKKDGLLFIYWVLTTKDIPEEDEIPGSIFQSYSWERVPPKLRDLDYISKFLSDGCFRDVKTAQLPYAYNTTIEERVGLQKTASAYEILSDEEKGRFLNEVAEVLTEKLGADLTSLLKKRFRLFMGLSLS